MDTGPDRALLAASVAFAAAAGLGSAVAIRDELPGEAVGVPLRVVRPTMPLEGIRQRLASDPTAERADTLREAEAQLAGYEGVGTEDLVVANDRPIATVAGEIMSWLGWE